MALPVAHAAAGYLVHRATHRGPSRGEPATDWRRVALFMLIGNLPDFDFLIGFVCGRPGMVHRGVSHTFLAAIAFGVVVGAVARWRRKEPFLPTAAVFGAAYASHLVLDWLSMDTRPPLGVQFLWPLSDAYYASPVPIFSEIRIDGFTRGGFLATVVAWPTLTALVREVVVVLTVAATWSAVTRVGARLGGAPAVRLEGCQEDLA